jgi:hypothetical protein
MKNQVIENINHSEKKSQVSEKVGEKERIEKLNEAFQRAWGSGFRKFIPCEGKRPDTKSINQFLKKQFGKGLKELRVNLYDIWELVKKEGKEKEWKEFLEQCITKGRNLALYGGYQEGRNSFLYYIDIDDKENDGKKKDEKLQLILEKFPELENSLKVETGSGYHIWFLSDVELANLNRKGIELRGEGLYVLFPYSKHPSGKIYEIKSGSVENLVKLDRNSAKKLLEFLGGIKEQRVKKEVVKTEKAITIKKSEAKSEAEANFSFAIISDEEYEWLKEKLKERHYHLWKILELGYEGETAFVGQKGFDRSRFEQALARALFEIYYDEGKYFEYSDDEMKSNVAGFLSRISHYKVFGREQITKVQERGEKYLSATVEKAFDYLQNKLPLSVHLRKEIENFAFSCIGKWFEAVLSDNQNYQAWHLNLVPGAGKTTSLINHIVQLKRDGKIGGETKQRVILVYATKELAEEVKRKLENEGINVLFLKGRDKDNCLKFGDEFRRILAEMGGNHAFYCKFVCELRDKCGYMIQQEKLRAIKGIFQGQSEYIDFGLSEIDVIITTYDYFCEWYELLLSISKIVIFDDVVPQHKALEVAKSEIIRTYRLIKQNEERLKNLNFQVDKVLNVLDNLKDGKVIEFDKEVIEDLRRILDELLQFSKREQDKDKIPNFHIPSLLKFIKENGVVKSEDGKSFVYYKFKQFDRLFHSLWLGWTYRTDLIRLALAKSVNFRVFEKGADAVFRNAIEIEMLNVPEATFRNLKRKEAVRKVISIVEQKIDEVQKQSKKILVVVPSEIENEAKEALGERDNISIIHYWGSETKGVNKFEDYDVVILVALPIPNVYQKIAQNKFLKKLAEEKGVELIEDIATDVKEHIWQIINRLRPFRKDYKKVKVYVIGKLQGKNNQIGFSVKSFLSYFKQKDEGNQKQFEMLNVGYKVYKEMGGVIPKILASESKDTGAKVIGNCSSEAKTFLFDLKNRFPYFPFLSSDDGIICKEYARNIKAYYKVCKDLQKLEQLESKRMKVLELRIQRKGKRNNEVEMDIVKTEISWGVVGDLEKFRKKLYEKAGILIYAVLDDDGTEQKIWDDWAFEKIAELQRIKNMFNKLNHLPSSLTTSQNQTSSQTSQQRMKTKELEKKAKEYQKAIETGLKQNKERRKKYDELMKEYERRLQNDKGKDLMDYPDLVLELSDLLDEIWAEHKAKKLISKLGYYDTS